ncbi:MAG: acetyl/propionyl/methylcrotonyl-CoA carboxylase subunit alpha [Betaproteobacteria bacterium]|nr:acetyl/propionyl/methylcrotonyl-CoA carboxylase subunit alpha [Betaproteobacteria bacterium]
MFRKILIANRGEIACRIMRTARRLGVRTVAVYSDADANALHVALADEAHRIGSAEAQDSYLRGERILEVARQCGAEAIHPGYGFLSENAGFADACARAGVVFIGPPADAIRAMGSKSAAKALMGKAGVPLVPGYHGASQEPVLLRKEAGRIGYPVLIKASAGGGGKGMRIVESAAGFDAALASCQRESQSAFGDAQVLLEKYLNRPRHIEIQVFADRHGNCIHLFERDCSVQRRHQKVLEEAPAPGMTEARRAEMGEAAVTAAKAVGYVGAGTVEFIAINTPDNPDGHYDTFYFMEMNTRLQVEHPVTEMITGQDLVEWQLRVACGERLPATRADLAIHGHAIEARIYAEDADAGFLPSTGRIGHLATPLASSEVRIDTGVRAGDVISPWYDPMLAKLIVHGRDRGEALARMRAALEAFEVTGPATNIEFLQRLVACEDFAEARLDTGLIARNHESLFAPRAGASEEVLALATLAELLDHEDAARRNTLASADPWSPWGLADGWRLNQDNQQVLLFRETQRANAEAAAASRETAITVHYRATGSEIELRGTRRTLRGGWQAGATHSSNNQSRSLRAILDGVAFSGTVIREGDQRIVFHDGRRYQLELYDPLAHVAGDDAAGTTLAAPMPGKIIAVLVAAGDTVEKNAPLMILEAMKMEHTITAPRSGIIAAIHYAVGEQVAEGAELASFAEAAP